jgi:hypothetical protein
VLLAAFEAAGWPESLDRSKSICMSKGVFSQTLRDMADTLRGSALHFYQDEDRIWWRVRSADG